MVRSMKKKVKIITIYEKANYGNRLQNYAVQTILENLGFDVQTISSEKGNLIRKAKYTIERITGYRVGGDSEYWKVIAPRLMAFERFNKKYIHTKHIRKIAQIGEADYFAIGSDQVWNPVWYEEGDLKKELFLLAFASPEKRVCFSPSFGVEELPEEWKPWFKTQLAIFPHLAVREDAGARIIKELTGKKASVLIDPTLMLGREEWNKIATRPQNINCEKKYVLTYFVGGRSDRVNNDLQKISKELNAEIYNLLDSSQVELYRMDPGEFIYLISKATLILTDSFHACVFSFLYEKPFLVYDRNDGYRMMSRIDTLLHKFDLERKYVDSNLANDLPEHDYKRGYDTLAEERQKFMDFLKTAMQ